MAVRIREGLPVRAGQDAQVPVVRNWVNVEQEVLHVTVDRLRLCLTQRMAQIKRSREWATPLGIVLTLLGTLLGSKFTDNILKATQWETLFSVAVIAGVVWLGVSGLAAWRNRATVEDIVDELKQGSSAAD